MFKRRQSFPPWGEFGDSALVPNKKSQKCDFLTLGARVNQLKFFDNRLRNSFRFYNLDLAFNFDRVIAENPWLLINRIPVQVNVDVCLRRIDWCRDAEINGPSCRVQAPPQTK